jgi:Zn-dependent peptidase ImmA (M78 family)
VNFPYLPNAAIDTEAERLRVQALGSKAHDIPVDLDAIVFDYLCEKDALVIDDETELPDEDGEEVLGKTFIRSNRIVINRRLKQSPDIGRYRFTLAHEIGHWQLHRPIVLAAAEQGGLFGDENNDVITTLNRSVVGPNPPRQEVQANRFAATLLIDREGLGREFSARFGPGELSAMLMAGPRRTIRERSRFVGAHIARGLPSLASRFRVSIEAMAIALETRGYLEDSPSLFPQ